MKRLIAGLGVTALLALTGCASSETETQASVECDKEDQVTYSADCGYWSGTEFVFWYWVVLGQTSHGPIQTAPAGASTVKPANAPAKPATKTQPKPPAVVPPKPANPGGGAPKPPPAPPKPPAPPPRVK